MNILHITDARGFSGGVNQILLLMRKIRDANLAAQALVCPGEGKVSKVFREDGFDVRDVSMFQDYDLKAAWKILKIIRDGNFDLVHAHHPKAHALALIAKYFHPFHLVVSRRVTHKIPWYPTSRWKYCSPKIDGYLCVSEAVKKELSRAGVDTGKLAVVASSTDFERFHPQEPPVTVLNELRALGLRGPIIGVIANYSLWKGQDLFLEAMSILGKQCRGDAVSAVLVGRDTDAEIVRGKIRQYELGGRVFALGWRADADKILSALDVLVNPSISGEGSSGVIREAFAMKISVIASDIEANTELVDSKKGWLFEARKASSLAQVINQFLDVPLEEKQKRAQNAFIFAREKFSVDTMVQKTLALYQKVLG